MCSVREKYTFTWQGGKVKADWKLCRIIMGQKGCAITLEKIETVYQKNILLEFSSEKVPQLFSPSSGVGGFCLCREWCQNICLRKCHLWN